jgi:hypothetical protein
MGQSFRCRYFLNSVVRIVIDLADPNFRVRFACMDGIFLRAVAAVSVLYFSHASEDLYATRQQRKASAPVAPLSLAVP